MPEHSPLNLDTFNRLKTLMGANFHVVLKEYLRSAEGFVSQMQTAAVNHNMESLALAAHPLKSSSAQIGATAVSQIAEEIENFAHTHNRTVDYASLFLQLEREFSSLKTTLNSHIA